MGLFRIILVLVFLKICCCYNEKKLGKIKKQDLANCFWSFPSRISITVVSATSAPTTTTEEAEYEDNTEDELLRLRRRKIRKNRRKLKNQKRTTTSNLI